MANRFLFLYSSVKRSSTLLVLLFFFKLHVRVRPSVSLKPSLHLSHLSRSCHSDLSHGSCFCCVSMSFRRRKTRRCCRPRCRASGRTTSGCRRSRRARWLASSKSPSSCATSTSPVSLARRRRRCAQKKNKPTPESADRERRKNRTTLYAQFLCPCIRRHIRTHILFNLQFTTASTLNPGPAGWRGCMQADAHLRNETLSSPLHQLYQQAALRPPCWSAMPECFSPCV